MDKDRVKYYLSEWGRLRRLNWNPGIGYKSVLPDLEVDDSMPEAFIEKIFWAMNALEKTSPVAYRIAELTYYSQKDDPDIIMIMDMSRRSIQAYRARAIDAVQYLLMGQAA